jgi:hypothetical protein
MDDAELSDGAIAYFHFYLIQKNKMATPFCFLILKRGFYGAALPRYKIFF